MKEIIVNTNYNVLEGIPSYYLFSMIGICCAVCVFMLLIAWRGRSVNRNLLILFLSWIGLFFGAYMFGIIKNVLQELYMHQKVTLFGVLNGNIIFYGGLTGMLASYVFLQKRINGEIDMYTVDCLAVVIPMFHIFGRIGCFFAGCCYGKESNCMISIGYILRGNSNVIYRIPVQLLEAIGNLFLFVLLFFIWLKNKKQNEILLVYLLVYSLMRFCLEFYRGDIHRGVFFGLSFSQIYSICIFMFVLVLKYRMERR